MEMAELGDKGVRQGRARRRPRGGAGGEDAVRRRPTSRGLEEAQDGLVKGEPAGRSCGGGGEVWLGNERRKEEERREEKGIRRGT